MLRIVVAVFAGLGSATAFAAPPPPFVGRFTAPPASVSDAIINLKTACVAWPTTQAAPPSPANTIEPPPALSSEATVCYMVENPEQAQSQILWSGGVLGFLATVAGLVLFSILRAVLVFFWEWRPLRPKVRKNAALNQ